MSGVEATAAWPSVFAILAALVMAVGVGVAGARQGTQAVAQKEELAKAAGLDPAQAATVTLYEIMSAALTQQTARADAQAQRVTELEARLYNQSDLLRTLQVDNEATSSQLRERNEELERMSRDAQALQRRVQELERIASRVPALTAERDEAIRKATAAEERVQHLEQEVGAQLADLAQLRGEVEKKA